MTKAMSVKKPGSPKRKGPSKEQAQESQVRRRIERNIKKALRHMKRNTSPSRQHLGAA